MTCLHQHHCSRTTPLWRDQVKLCKLAERIDLILSALEILPLETPADRQYASLRHHLTRQATPIGPNDLLIAAHALANDLTVITANVGEFSRVPGLKVENWLQN